MIMILTVFPARRTEDVTLPFYRTDEPLTAGGPIPNPNSLFGVIAAQNGDILVTQNGDILVTQGPEPIVEEP